MKRRTALRLFIILGLTAILSSLFAGITGASNEKILTLDAALRYAFEGNPELRASGRELLANREEIGIAFSNLLPKLTFEERFMRTDNPTYVFMAKLNQKRFEQTDFDIISLNNPAPVNDFQTSLFFEQALFAPKAKVGIDMAKKDYSSREEEFGRKKESVALDVFKTYLGVQTAKAFVSVAEKGVEDAREHVRIAGERYDAGLGLYSDTLRAKVALSSAEEKLVSAAKNLDVAKRGLGLLLGLAESVDVAADRPVFHVGSLEYYSGLSVSRKDLKSAELKYRNAENALRMSNAGYLPVIGIGGGYQLNDHNVPLGSEGNSWQLTAFLRWDLFDGMKREHEKKKAVQNIEAAREHLEGFRKTVSFQLYEAYASVNEAKKKLELARAAVESAEEGTRLVQKRYENSLAPIIDLLDAQTGLDSFRAEEVERESGYLSAIGNLYFQSGTILGELGVGK